MYAKYEHKMAKHGEHRHTLQQLSLFVKMNVSGFPVESVCSFVYIQNAPFLQMSVTLRFNRIIRKCFSAPTKVSTTSTVCVHEIG